MTTRHYSAVLTVTETTTTPPAPTGYDRRIQPDATPKRETDEVLKLVLRDATLPGLASKLSDHLAIHVPTQTAKEPAA
ncbi:hypothetical protein SEA_BARNSTORMER_32 [Microbacterium phage Barnstormer]|uniref:Uncharacterized protein n=1 Tax=Microbacterium phage Barnstormer TaxID=3028491 RepID=A0AAE9ZSR7_9CAUD|nr:hypothetical protein SEA_BARNSTORMER_32 [Microbacterium phage Barnstormer]WDS52138.1 hypothetical protein SEA_UTZCHIPS_32 [Microbacterium phage UtzChips]